MQGRATNYKTTYMCTLYSVIFFRLDTPKNTAKAPAVDIMRLNTLSGTKIAFFNP